MRKFNGIRRLMAAILTLVLLFALAAPALADYEDAKNGVVRLYVDEFTRYYDLESGKLIDEELSSSWIGSGFAVGVPGEPVRYFVTNRHVVPERTEEDTTVTIQDSETGEKMEVRAIKQVSVQPYIVFTNTDEMVAVNLVAASDRCDLSIVELNEASTLRQPLVIHDFQNVNDLGHVAVYALGFPAVSDTKIDTTLDKTYSYLENMTFTEGIVNQISEDSVTHRGQEIQHTAKVSGGNSGGPLVDADGTLVGVNRATYTGDNTAYCLAVSANEVMRLLDQERIPYRTLSQVKRENAMRIAAIAGIAAVVILLAVIVALKLRKKGAKKNAKPEKRDGDEGYTLVGDLGALAGKPFALRGRVSIGRNADVCGIAFPEDTRGVSGVHCTITVEGGTVRIVDEHSSYGTKVDQMQLVPGQAVEIRRGQRIYLGSQQQSMVLR